VRAAVAPRSPPRPEDRRGGGRFGAARVLVMTAPLSPPRAARTALKSKVSPLKRAAALLKKKQAKAALAELRVDIDALRGEGGRIRTFEENRQILTVALERRCKVIESGGTISNTQLAGEIGAQFHVSHHGKTASVLSLLKNWDEEKVVIVAERDASRGRGEYWELRKLKPHHLVEIEKFINTRHHDKKGGRVVTKRAMIKHLNTDRPGPTPEDPLEYTGVKFSCSAISRALSKYLGYKWGPS
jgi:hypothetical protein